MGRKKKLIPKTDKKNCKTVTEGFRFKGASKVPAFHPPVESWFK